MDGLQVSLFGRLSVKWAGEEAMGFEAKKVQELFAYLLVFRTRTHSREVLAELLWGDRQSAQSRKYLRQALWQLQSVLEKASICESTQWLDVDAEWVQVSPAAGLWLDVAELERASVQAQGVAGGDLSDEGAQALERAVQLYRGDFLEGCYQDWCIFERERLQNVYLNVLDKLMDHCQSTGDFQAGLTYGAQMLRLDRARERTHRRMMRMYYLAGDRTAALRQYARCAAALSQELGVKPSQRTEILCEQIRDDSAPVGSVLGGLTAPRSSDPVGNQGVFDEVEDLGDVLRRLETLQRDLSSMQQQLDRDVRAVRRVLEDPGMLKSVAQ